MGQRSAEVGGGIALPQEHDLAGVIAGEAALGGAKSREEERPGLADPGEGFLELIEISATPVPRLVSARGRDLAAGTARGQLMPGDQLEISGIDEDLGLGHTHREDVGDVVVGDGVAVAVDGDEAVDAAHPVDDTGGIVGVGGQRPQVWLLLGESLDRCRRALLAAALVANATDPHRQLGAHVLEIAEATPVEKAPLEFPEAPFRPGLVVRVSSAHCHRRKLVVRGEGEVAGVVDGLLPLPAQHHGFLAVVLARGGRAAQALEGLDVAIHQRKEVAALVDEKHFRRLHTSTYDSAWIFRRCPSRKSIM